MLHKFEVGREYTIWMVSGQRFPGEVIKATWTKVVLRDGNRAEPAINTLKRCFIAVVREKDK